MPEPHALRTPFELTRASPFAYACRACSRCCWGKRIPINPYEVARLAEVLGQSTTEFLERHTTNGGSLLAVRDDGACVFLGQGGCTVHAGRPLACRLYPLGRRVSSNGDEMFAEVVPHPRSEGRYGGEGTVDGFLRQQDTARHIAAADRYRTVLQQLVAALTKREDAAESYAEANEAMTRSPSRTDESLLDVDAV